MTSREEAWRRYDREHRLGRGLTDIAQRAVEAAIAAPYVEAIRALAEAEDPDRSHHAYDESDGECAECFIEWPCPFVRLRALIEPGAAAIEERAEEKR